MSAGGFRRPSWNGERLKLLDLLVHHAREQGARLLLLPAGFVSAESEDEVLDLLLAIARRADEVTIIGGVDLLVPWLPAGTARGNLHHTRALDAAAREGRLPFFGFAVGATPDRWQQRWRQTSTSPINALTTPAPGPGEERLVLVDGVRVAVVLSGELYGEGQRRAMPGLRAGVIAICGHLGMPRLSQSLSRWSAKLGTPGARPAIAAAQHLLTQGKVEFRDRHGTDPEGTAPGPQRLAVGSLWALATARDV